jgi:hypothetical protein
MAVRIQRSGSRATEPIGSCAALRWTIEDETQKALLIDGLWGLQDGQEPRKALRVLVEPRDLPPQCLRPQREILAHPHDERRQVLAVKHHARTAHPPTVEMAGAIVWLHEPMAGPRTAIGLYPGENQTHVLVHPAAGVESRLPDEFW